MFDSSQILLFLTATSTLLLIPGPAVLYIVAQSIERGARFGVASTAGIALGGLFHVAAAVLGLSAILATSATAFSAIKYLGAAYLIYLGVSKLLEKPTGEMQKVNKSVTLMAAFKQGIVVQILNPKIALFFLSFLPQFMNPRLGNPTFQIAVLGLSFVMLAFITDAFYALFAAKFSGLLSKRLKGSGLSKWLSGCTYIGLGILTVATGNRKVMT